MITICIEQSASEQWSRGVIFGVVFEVSDSPVAAVLSKTLLHENTRFFK